MQSKPKAVKIGLIPREENGKQRAPYVIADRLVAKYHPHLASAKIAFAVSAGWQEDVDGHVRLGHARKSNDLDRELHEYDFVIILNVFALNTFNMEQLSALIDHELCHCEIAKDENGEEKRDERGRPVWRTRKHDIEEFSEIVARHGLYKDDLRKFLEIVIEIGKAPLLASVKE